MRLHVFSSTQDCEILSTAATPLLPEEIVTHEFANKVSQMFDLMYRESGIGLAANQAGWDAHVFVMHIPDEQSYVFVNGSILKGEYPVLFEESCLSLPGEVCRTRRYSKVHVRYWDLSGKIQEAVFSGLAAICIQHELEHLSGRSMFDSELVANKSIDDSYKL